MAGWSGMGAGARTAVVAVIAVLFGGGGYEVWRMNHAPAPQVGGTVVPVVDATAGGVVADTSSTAPAADVAVTDPTKVAPAAATATDAAPASDASATAVVDAGTTAPPPAAPPTAAPPLTAAAPSFDLVRIDADGSAVIAGQAAAGAEVSLLVDGVEAAKVVADGNGNFVGMFTLPPSGAGRMLTMAAKLADGSVVPSATSVALAATAAPVAVAAGNAGTAPAADVSATAAVPTPTVPDAQTAGTTAGTTALAVTDGGVKVLQTGSAVPADVAANVALQAIAYPSSSDVQFAGVGMAGGFVRIYLDNTPVGDAIAVAADGSWTVTLPGIAPGLYTLRVDQIDAAGKVTSRFETPFKRETPEALAAASGSAPAVVVADAGSVAANTPVATATADAGTTVLPADTAATGSSTSAVVTTPDAGATAQASDQASTNTTATTQATTSTGGGGTAAAPDATGTAAGVATADAGANVAPDATAPSDTSAAATTNGTTVADASTTTETEATSATTANQTAAAAATTVAPVADTTVATETAVVAPATDTAVAAPGADTAVAAPAASTAVAAPVADTSAALPPMVTITVQPGYTLWGIAKANMGKGIMYVQVYDANRDKIRNPDLIYPGQVFLMPKQP